MLLLARELTRPHVKRARPAAPSHHAGRVDTLITTSDVARLLRVHPKHVYRLLRVGLPAHRVGGEWRFLTAAVLAWSGAAASTPEPGTRRAIDPGIPAAQPG